jgi:LysM domain
MFKFLTLLFLGLLIFGSAGYFGYELFIRPEHVDRLEKSAEAKAAATPLPTPDPGIGELQKLKAMVTAGDMVSARDGLKGWLGNHPKSPLMKEAMGLYGNANMTLLFQTTTNSPDNTYIVVRGDSLAKIASRKQSNAELIQKANNLPGTALTIGQQLVIPSIHTSLELDRAGRTLILLNNGAFVKEYDLLSAPPAPKKTLPAVNTKILDKIATSGTKRVAFGDKSYAQSERMILLAGNPSILGIDPPKQTILPAASSPQTNALSSSNSPVSPVAAVSAQKPSPSPAPSELTSPLPPGYVLTKEELLEIFPLVSRNTPVIIH